MMFLLTCDKKLTKSQFSPTHASTKRKITDELKQGGTKSVKAVRLKSSGQSVGRRMIYGGKDLWSLIIMDSLGPYNMLLLVFPGIRFNDQV